MLGFPHRCWTGAALYFRERHRGEVRIAEEENRKFSDGFPSMRVVSEYIRPQKERGQLRILAVTC